MISVLLLAAHMIVLTGPDHQIIEINPKQIVSLRSPRSTEHFGAGVKCLVFTTDSKFTGVLETCEQVFHLMENE